MHEFIAGYSEFGTRHSRPPRTGAGRNNDFLGSIVLAVHFNFVRGDKSAFTADHGDIRTIERAVFAFGPARDNMVFARDDGWPVKSQTLAVFYPEFSASAGAAKELDGADQHLFWNSAGFYTRAGEIILFDDRDSHA